ncbi:class I SAM-dependent methyltransferase [Geomonas sp. Red32]|uniref:class I SAM-dependent methyltransferase n=1 Tax=Geomonas sp. Red32 TaxID=2912856 RepID=UPI00202CB2E3|nr:class I SAM-dependent methyltransferase [Geomonas sp. Red32]
MAAEVREARGELRGAVPLSHFLLRGHVGAGELAVDATCGNGGDTALLAELVGEGGRVWAFDLQPVAIEATRALLEEKGLSRRVELVQAGHEGLAGFVPEGLSAVVFNLGYLPGGDPALVTSPESTVAALGQAAALLKPGGIVTAALYTGHPGGPEEAAAVEEWAAALDPRRFNVWTSRQLNRSNVAPYLVWVEKV